MKSFDLVCRVDDQATQNVVPAKNKNSKFGPKFLLSEIYEVTNILMTAMSESAFDHGWRSAGGVRTAVGSEHLFPAAIVSQIADVKEREEGKRVYTLL